MNERVRAAVLGFSRPRCGYVYDPAAAVAAARAVRAALPSNAALYYAVKANGHPAILRALASEVDTVAGLEVASGGELELALAAGARSILFGGPAKTDEELAHAVDAGATVNVESRHELRRLTRIAAGRRPRITIRVNRAGAALPGSHQMAGVPTQFGVAEEELPSLVAEAGELDLVGFHLHAVSNNLDAAAHAKYVTDAVDWSVRTAALLGVPLKEVNVGGGLGVDPTATTHFDLDRLAAGLSGLTGPRVVVEPGRYLAANAGWYAAEVLDVKHTHGRWFAVLRGGTHHFRLPAAWGYSHPFEILPVPEWPYPFERPEVRDAPVDVAGELCTPRDILSRDRHVDRLRAGDVLVFAGTGAYGWDISHDRFLRHPPPEFTVI